MSSNPTAERCHDLKRIDRPTRKISY